VLWIVTSNHHIFISTPQNNPEKKLHIKIMIIHTCGKNHNFWTPFEHFDVKIPISAYVEFTAQTNIFNPGRMWGVTLKIMHSKTVGIIGIRKFKSTH